MNNSVLGLCPIATNTPSVLISDVCSVITFLTRTDSTLLSYQSAQDHLKTAQLMFVGLIPELKNTNPEDVIEVQSGLLLP